MCGVWGYVSRGKHGPDLVQLKRIARINASRGPHAFGFAWLDGNGRMRCYKQAGRLVDSIGLLGMARDARILIGHCRFTTQGSEENNLNNHPHPADGGWFVHNGMIRDYRLLIREHALYPNSECDSELLGLLVEDAHGSWVDRWRWAVNRTARSPLVVLGASRPSRMVAVRRGNPLNVGIDDDGFYLGSLTDDLPGEVFEFRDDTISEITAAGIKSQALQIPVRKAGAAKGLPEESCRDR